MKYIFPFFILSLVTSLQLQAQYEWEYVFNERKKQSEWEFRPWNETQQAHERELEKQRGQHNENIRQINETYRRYEEQRQDMMLQQQQNFADMNYRLNSGQIIINAGKATTLFKPSPNFSVKNYLLQKTKGKEWKQVVEQYADICFKNFQDELKKRGLNPYDYVESKVLSFLLCYEVYFVEKPSLKHQQWCINNAKPSYLKSALFQSTESIERQQKAEATGVLALYSVVQLNKSKAGDSLAYKEAKSVARLVLESLWGNGVNTIAMTKDAFTHKGQQIISNGKSTHSYNFNPQIKSWEFATRNLGPDFKTQLQNEYKTNLNFFYQEMQKRGWPKTDMAWHLTGTAYALSYTTTGGVEWNEKQINSVYDFFKNIILKSPDIQAASDDSRQMALEVIAIQALSAYASFVKEKDIVSKSTARGQLNSLFKMLGENLENYQWTEDGIKKLK